MVQNLAGRASLLPLARDADPMSVRFHMYIDFVPFGVFAILSGIALRRRLGLPRVLATAIFVLPMAAGSLIYVVWWIGLL